MHLVGLYTYCKMVHGVYNFKLWCKSIITYNVKTVLKLDTKSMLNLSNILYPNVKDGDVIFALLWIEKL